MGNLFQELKRRNVFKVGAVYVVVAWLLIQIVTAVLPTFNAPEWVSQTIIFLLALGLPITLIIVWAFELTPQGIRKTETADTDEAVATGLGDYALGALLLVVLGFMTVQQFDLFDTEEGMETTVSTDRAAEIPTLVEEPASPTIEPSTPIDDMSIAVLVLRNESPDPDNAYFAAGIHEEILNQLAKISALQVTSRTTVLRYADSDLGTVDIAREINVGTVMEGSVRFAGNRVKITLQLIDAINDVHLWSEIYDFELDDIFAIQSEVALQVADSMQSTLNASEIANIQRPLAANTEAYTLYLQWRYQESRGNYGDLVDTGISLMRQAISKDPSFALGMAELAFLLRVKGQYTPIEERPTVFEEAFRYANRAIEIDPNIARAHDALAFLHFILKEFSEWEEHARKAISLPDPEGRANLNYGINLAALNRFEEAYDQLDRAILTDPFSNIYHGFAIRIKVRGKDYESALSLTDQFLAVGGNEESYHAFRAYLYDKLGRDNESRIELSKITSEPVFDFDLTLMYYDYLRCKAGEEVKVKVEINNASERWKEGRLTYCAAGSGNTNEIFESLKRSMDAGGRIAPRHDIYTSEITSDPRWQEIAEYVSFSIPF